MEINQRRMKNSIIYSRCFNIHFIQSFFAFFHKTHYSFMKYVFVMVCSLALSITYAQQKTIGIFKNNKDIGKPAKAGGASYDEASQSYHLKGAGYNIWFERDEFNYLYNKLAGDFVITANFEFIDKGTD